MAIDWGAFVKGFAGAAASQIEERTKAERDALMEEKRLQLVEKYKIQEESRAEARGKKKVASEQADYANGVAILYNADREKIGERPLSAAEIEDRTWTKQDRELRRRQAEASIGASNRSGRGGYGGGGDDTPTDKSRNRVEGVLSKIDARLEDLGAPPAERLAARQAVLKKVAGGQSIDQAWLDRYESNLIGGFQKNNKLDQWGAEKIKRDAAAAAL